MVEHDEVGANIMLYSMATLMDLQHEAGTEVCTCPGSMCWRQYGIEHRPFFRISNDLGRISAQPDGPIFIPCYEHH